MPENEPDLVKDILDLSIFDLPEEWRRPDIVWASPPCQRFSVMTLGRNWKKINDTHHIPLCREAEKAYGLVVHTLMLIQELGPKYYIIENPCAKLRKLWPMTELPRYRVTYCQYGDTRMKPTDIWTNAPWTPRPNCSPGDPCHDASPRGSRTGTQSASLDPLSRSQVPADLCKELIQACEGTYTPPQASLGVWA